MKDNIYAYTLEELETYFSSIKEKKFRASQVFNWLYHKRVNSFNEMKNLPKNLIEHLEETFDIEVLELDMKQESSDGTVKFLFRVRDEHYIESVLMRHNYGYSVCVSTQIGCKMGCTFCASTIGGVERNLDAGEITCQVLEIQKYLDDKDGRVSSIVIMGSGEPFDNFDYTMKFIEIIKHEKTLNIGARHITLSTSGIVPRIYQFADLNSQVTLAISLHATTNAVRSMIMPINKAYPLEKLIEAIMYYNRVTNRRVSLEFGLLNGVNDTIEEAKRLANLVRPLLCHVNVIPINYVIETNYEKPTQHSIKRFVKALEEEGINATVRREKGSDIDAACGQLRAKKAKKEIVCQKD
ncbi:23S rRNA (adenine(2503)-C(2))-methyltransferase RlmN [Mycoplasmatota bacterium]|nr:23S rRNA (adenine(2503)-C(2))-methyltransferase RlmN [Mycoplasmatota bacterium]